MSVEDECNIKAIQHCYEVLTSCHLNACTMIDLNKTTKQQNGWYIFR